MQQDSSANRMQRLINVQLQKTKSVPLLFQKQPLSKLQIGFKMAQKRRLSPNLNAYRVLASTLSPTSKPNNKISNSQRDAGSRIQLRLRQTTPKRLNDSVSNLSIQQTSIQEPKQVFLGLQNKLGVRKLAKKQSELLSSSNQQRSLLSRQSLVVQNSNSALLHPERTLNKPTLSQYLSNGERQKHGNLQLYNIEQSKRSQMKIGLIKAYSANTHQGLFRNYNEDRVSIILSISKPNYKTVQYWPKCSFFAVYDGHGGAEAADFLRDNLHLYIIKEETFPEQVELAIKRGVQKAEQAFLNHCEETGNRSGSCAIFCLFLDDICYTANIGDSRCILSKNRGKEVQQISRDHKPSDEQEKKRIEMAGGHIYQQSSGVCGTTFFIQGKKFETPFRVFPGKLSVSRTIGDIEAKVLKYGGNSKVVVSEPEIMSFKVTDEHDFLVIGSDGIFDRLESSEVSKCIWNSHQPDQDNLHLFAGRAVEQLFFQAFEQKTLDNITAVMICFKGLKKYLFPKQRKIAEPVLEKPQTQQESAQRNKSILTQKLVQLRSQRQNSFVK